MTETFTDQERKTAKFPTAGSLITRIRARLHALTVERNRRATGRELRTLPAIVRRDIMEVDRL